MTSDAVHITWGHRVARGWSDPLWVLPGVRPMPNPITAYPATYGAPGADPAPNTAAGIGDQLYGWFRHYADELDALGVTFTGWSLIAPHIGDVEEGVTKTIFGASGDYVTGLSAGQGRDTSPLHSAGLAAAIPVAEAAFGRLAELLSAGGNPAPAFMLEDCEHGPYALDLWRWGPKLADGTEPRGATDLILDGRSFVDLLDAAARGDGSAISGSMPTTDGWWQVEANRGWYYWISHLCLEVRDAARVRLKKDTARALWPTIQYANYDDVATRAGSVVPWDYSWNIREYNRRARGPGSALVLYPVMEWHFDGQTWAGILAWCTALSVTPIGDGTSPADVVRTLRAVTVAWSKAKIDEAVAANRYFGASDLIAAWMPTIDFAAEHDLAGGVWGLEAQDIREIALYAVAAGIRVFIWWWNDLSPNVLSAPASDALAALIAEINTATEVPVPDLTTPPPTRFGARMLTMAARHVRRFGTERLTITERVNGALNPATGKRSVTERSITVTAVRRPVAAEPGPAGNDRRTPDSTAFAVTAADLAAAIPSDNGPPLTLRRGLLVTDSDNRVYTVHSIDRETDRAMLVLNCQKG